MSDFNKGGIVLSYGYSAQVKRGQAVKFDAADRSMVKPVDGAGDKPLGIYSAELNSDTERPNSGEAIAVTAEGLARSFAGAAIEAGDELAVSASGAYQGYLIPVKTLGLAAGKAAWVVGTALQDAALKQQVEVLVKPYQYVAGT